ncbi:MAG: TonB-dependent receptor [Gammaproteobacteria bacterium]|nr:TonB-dependent receptor [Gammaproteobacteria bacterium]
MRKNKLYFLALSMIYGLLSTNYAFSEPGAKEKFEIEEVIVTAQKRAEKSQDIPIAISAFSQQVIKKTRMYTLDDIAQLTPSFIVGQHTPTQPELSIRGIASTDREAGSDRSVVVFVDEVYIGRAGASTFDLFDLERIEVLRGPQGTLYGKNVTGGAVNIITAKPTDQNETRLLFTAGNYDLEAKGMFNRVLSDNINGRITFSVRKKDGIYQNVNLGKTSNGLESFSGRAQFAFLISEKLRALLTFELSSDDIDGVNNKFFQGWENSIEDFKQYVGSAPPFRNLDGTPFEPAAGMYNSENNIFGYANRDSFAVYSRITADRDYGTWTFIPAYRSNDLNEYRDGVGMRLRGSGANSRGFSSGRANDEYYDAVSLELRLSSPQESRRLTWISGLYYINEDIDRTQTFSRQLGNGYSAPSFAQAAVNSGFGIFGQATWALNDRFNLTFGGRYTKDTKDWDLDVTNTLSAQEQADLTDFYGRPPSIAPARQLYSISTSKSWTDFSPKVALDYKVNEDVMLYASWAEGYKSGGFPGTPSTAVAALISFKPETVTSTEVGIKSQWYDRRVQFNLNLFSMDFKEMQQRDTIMLPDGTAIGTVSNVGSAKVKGVEVEFIILPTEDLTLSGSLSVIDATVTQTNISNNFTTILAGKDLPRSPDNTFNLAVDYAISPAWGFRVDYRHVGDHYFDLNENIAGFQPAYNLLSARLGFSAPGGWTIALWGKNLTNEEYMSTAQSFRTPRSLASTGLQNGFATVAFMGQPRTYGVTVTKQFGN